MSDQEPTITPKKMREVFTDEVLAELPSDKNWRRAAAAYKRSQDPEWQANHKAATQSPEFREKARATAQAKAQDPAWLANVKAAAQAKCQKPEVRAKLKAASQKRAQDAEWCAKQKADAIARAKDPEWHAMITAANRRTRMSRCKPYHTPQGDFDSIADAIEASGVNKNKFRELAKADPANYYYLPKPTE